VKPFHWKKTLTYYSPPRQKTPSFLQSPEQVDSLLPLPSFRHPRDIIVVLAMVTISWLRSISSVLQQTVCLFLGYATVTELVTPPPPTKRSELPMTIRPLPYVHVSDIHTAYEVSDVPRNCADIYWNTVYDPRTDQLYVYTSSRVRIYQRQRHSQRFVYLSCKPENSFPKQSMIPLGHWQNSYFILHSTKARPLRSLRSKPRPHPAHQESPLHQDTLPSDSPKPPSTEPPSRRLIPVQRCIIKHRGKASCINQTLSRLRIFRSHLLTAIDPAATISNLMYIFHRSHDTSILRLSARYLTAYFGIAEVYLVQNTDPG
jgi:hypothetical protein